MLNLGNVAVLVFLSSFVLPRSTAGEKAEDCVKGKQYWSKSAFINPNGACTACPPYWQNCNKEAGGDKDRCIESCRVEPKTKPKTKPNKMTSTTPSYNDIRSTTTSVQSQPQPTSTRIVHSTSTILAFSSQIYRGKPNDKSGHDKPGKIIAIVVPLTVVFLLVLFAALVRLIQSRRKRAEKERLRRVGIEENGRSQNALPIQDTRLDLRRGGTQETEKDDMQDIK